jgi:hypothetical protein
MELLQKSKGSLHFEWLTETGSAKVGQKNLTSGGGGGPTAGQSKSVKKNWAGEGDDRVQFL